MFRAHICTIADNEFTDWQLFDEICHCCFAKSCYVINTARCCNTNRHKSASVVTSSLNVYSVATVMTQIIFFDIACFIGCWCLYFQEETINCRHTAFNSTIRTDTFEFQRRLDEIGRQGWEIVCKVIAIQNSIDAHWNNTIKRSNRDSSSKSNIQVWSTS